MIPAKRTSAQLSDSEQSRGRSSRGIGPQDDFPSLVHTTYRKVCQQFDDWSKADFALSMKSLVSAETGSEDRGDIVQQLEHLNLQETEMAHTIPLPLSVVSLDAVLSPLPLYNSCTPISANQFTGDDSSRMSFIPLADDPSFDWEAHCENYKDFAWQTTFFDSDLYSIVFECARRLHQQHGLSYSQIDETGILPLSLTSTENGVLRTTHYQGAFDWADTRSYIRTKHPPSPSVPMLTEFNELVYQFCNSSSCMMGFCDQHIDWSPMPQPFSVAPSSSSNDLFNNIVTPCSTDCFILRVPGNTSNLHPTEWTPNDEDTLDILLRHAPDASPCDLAVINKKSCFEVYRRRMRILPDTSIKKIQPERRLPPLKLSSYNDLNSDRFHPNPPCRHEGPCDATSDCACFKNKAHCERGCRCDLKTCRRRWPGCNCIRSRISRPCGTDRCACFKAHRECDPELCGKCGARDQFCESECSNVAIQRGYRKATETKAGSWGWGLFLQKVAEPGELIVEYVGELIYEPTTSSRDDLSRHRQKNYLFGLNSTLAVDGEFSGNESRFINHSTADFNCRAQVKLVHGNHRIGVYAHTRIRTGTELLLNYGTSFFDTTTE